MGYRIVTVLAALLLIVAAAGGIAWILAADAQPRGKRPLADDEFVPQATSPAASRPKRPSPAIPASDREQFIQAWEQEGDPAKRVLLLGTLRDKPWAHSRLPVLVNAYRNDSDVTVAQTAFEIAASLSKTEGGVLEAELIRSGMDCFLLSIKQRALQLARDRACDGLLDDVLEAGNKWPAVRNHAIEALAFCPDPRAKRAVLDYASRDDLAPNERTRAVALLAKTRDPEARPLLHSLRQSPDASLRRVAEIVLRELNATQK